MTIRIGGKDGEVFANLTGGVYIVFIKGTGVENTQEVANSIVGPVVISGAGSAAFDVNGKKNSIKFAF